jgi:hypothetical protein
MSWKGISQWEGSSKGIGAAASSSPKWHAAPGWFITPEIDGLAGRGENDHCGRGPCEHRSRHNEGGCNASALGMHDERSSSGFVHQRLRGNAGRGRDVRVIAGLALGLGEALPGYAASEIAGEWRRDTGETTPDAEGPSRYVQKHIRSKHKVRIPGSMAGF